MSDASASEAGEEPIEQAPPPRREALAWQALLLVLVLAGLWIHFAEAWREGPSRFVPFPRSGDESRIRSILYNDQQFVIWGIGRNGRALVGAESVFDAGVCHPTKNSLALGEPMIWQGWLGLPSRLVDPNPVLAYNVSLALTFVLAGLAMYWLVASWSGVPAAGVVAGLLFAFEPSRLADVAHLFIYDTTGLVLALLFAPRLFAHGRIRDAIGLGAAGAIQVATSFYPLLAAAAIGIPVAIWLIWRFGLRRALWSRLAISAAIIGAAALFVYLPYLALDSAGAMPERSRVVFATRPGVLPGGKYFPGTIAALLALASLPWPPRALHRLRSDPRPALLIGSLLVVWLSLGHPATRALGLPHLYDGLAQWLPGLAQVRVPARITVGLTVVACVLAGLGVSALLRLVPAGAKRRIAAAIAIAPVFVACSFPSWFGLRAYDHRAREAAPTAAQLDFIERLDLVSQGPLIELPFSPEFDTPPRPRPHFMNEQTSQVFLQAYHGRRTSGCISSYEPDRQRLFALEHALEDPAALDELREMGFTTLVVRNERIARATRAQLQRAAEAPEPRVRLALAHPVADVFVFLGEPESAASEPESAASVPESAASEPESAAR